MFLKICFITCQMHYACQ